MYKFFVKLFIIILFFLSHTTQTSLKSNSQLYKQYSRICHTKLLNLSDDVFYPIFSLLSNKERNIFQRVSHKARAIGSKRIPNFYKLAACQQFVADEKDYIYGFINAIYDKNEKMINVMQSKIQNKLSSKSEELKVEIPIYINKDYPNENISIFFTIYKQKINITTNKLRNIEPNPLIMACYAGNLKKIKQLLDDKNSPKDFDMLCDAFSIAMHKNDFDCLKLFISERNKQKDLINTFLDVQLWLLALAFDLNNEEAFAIISSSNWEKVNYYQFPAIMLINEDVMEVVEGGGISMSYETGMYRKYTIKKLLNTYNQERKRRGWKTSIEIFIEQDQDLNITIKKPLIEALQKNNIYCLRQLVGEIENKQLFYDDRCMHRLRIIHLELLLQALESKNKEVFDTLSRLRLENEKDYFGDYHKILLKLIKDATQLFIS